MFFITFFVRFLKNVEIFSKASKKHWEFPVTGNPIFDTGKTGKPIKFKFLGRFARIANMLGANGVDRAQFFREDTFENCALPRPWNSLGRARIETW